MRSSHALVTEPELYAAALRALMRRAHSVHEMKQFLGRRSENEEMIRRIVDKLKEHRYLDDARYALDFARKRAQGRRQGQFRIARELRSRGVPDRHIESALAAIFAETDEASLIRARLKKLLHSSGPTNDRKIASAYRSLLRAGFSSDLIRAELRTLSRSEVPESPAFDTEQS